VSGDLALALAELQRREAFTRFSHGQRSELADARARETHGARFRTQALAFAILASLGLCFVLGPPRLLACLLLVEPLQAHARAVAALAPAVARVVREEPRVERLEAAPAARARALGREELAGVAGDCFGGRRGGAHCLLRRALAHGSNVARGDPGLDNARGYRIGDAHHVAAELERLRERGGQRGAVRRRDLDLADGQVDVVLLEAAQARPLGRRRHDAVDAQRREPALRGPLRELR